MSKDPTLADPPKKSGWGRQLGSAFFIFSRCSLYLLGLAWAAGAIYFDAPMSGELGRTVFAIGYVVVVLFFLAGLVTPLRRFAGWILSMALVIVPWLFITPSNQGNWEPPWAETAWAEVAGDSITFHNFRNFDYKPDGIVVEQREQRTVHLSKLQGLDYFHHDISNGGLVSHPLLSFDFGEDGHVAFSVEVRYQEGQKFSVVKGLYKQYTLIYLVGDERDFVRERANLRDQPVRLYRSSYSEEHIRDMFSETVHAMNKLKDKPRFYHSVIANCTTSYLAQAPPGKRARLDYRVLLNGKLESLLYERAVIVTDGLSFDELVERASINKAAKAAHDDPDFSAKIRAGRPGF